ncbi:hypothetical protein G5B30_02525 [Sphingobacterium sp. SGG-5]|uniref:hypothetical protein n=1 Tax=Sphingobacterium sp. SGG-5 TaxID=2710881 RepID=UPI0013EC93CA|nr:hypothetical protein [Sphingobacterium sp. SGG-5]NGM60785.1 hypothetical protein [Sphingobacterium sp. SGG-5]
MNSYIYFIRALRYSLVFVVACSIALTIDREFCDGALDNMLTQLNPRLIIGYIHPNFIIEAVFDYTKADSTGLPLRLLMGLM